MLIFNGLSPTFDFLNGAIVVVYQALTIYVGCAVFYLVFRSKIKGSTFWDAIFIIIFSNWVTFLIGSSIYTALNGYGWLFTSYGATPSEEHNLFLLFLFLPLLLASPLIVTWFLERFEGQSLG